MDDFSVILTALKGLGPWGVAAGIGLTFLVRYLRSRQPDVINVPKPTDPLPDTERFPILSRLLKLFGAKAVKDLTPEAIEALSVELEDAAGMHLEHVEQKRATLTKFGKARGEAPAK